MKVHTKIIVLLVIVTSILISLIAVYQFIRREEYKIYLRSKLESDHNAIIKMLDLIATNKLNQVIDNAMWDDAVGFMQTRDTLWANDNLAISLTTFNFSYFNVYKPDGTLHYSASDSTAPEFTISSSQVSDFFKNQKTVRTFVFQGGRLFEIFGSVIVPSWDLNLESESSGFLIGIKHWDNDYLNRIGLATGFTIEILPDTHQIDPEEQEHSETIYHSITDHNGKEIAALKFFRENQLAFNLEAFSILLMHMFFVLLAALTIYIILNRKWLANPLRAIATSLINNDIRPIIPLEGHNNEFGEIARLIRKFYEQKDELLKEIKTRTEATEKYRALLVAQPDTMILADELGLILDSYAGNTQNLEAAFGDFKGQNIRDILPPKCLKDFDHAVKVLATAGGVQSFECEMALIDAIHFFEIRMANADQNQLLLSIRDITELKNTQDEILKSKLWLEQISRMASVGGWEKDLIHHHDKWSEITREIFEVDADFIPDMQNSVEFYKEGACRDIILKAVSETMQTGEIYDVEVQIITAKGKERWVRTIGKRILKDGMCVRLQGTIQDITQQKQIEEQLRHNEQNLRELNATKDKFLSIIAHDLKNPFNSILGFSEMLQDEAKLLDFEKTEAFARIIHATATQTLLLLENLLKWARSQQGTLAFAPRKLLLGEIAKDVIDCIADTAKQKSISIINQIPAELIINADKDMLKTILLNLLTNATKFTHRNGTVELSAKVSEGLIQIAVHDNGVGISIENQEKLFRIGSDFTMRGTNNEKGTGLGLILCREFVEKHGGRIWVNSEPEKGSTFQFVIPADINRS